MKQALFIWALCVLLLGACQTKEPEKPDAQPVAGIIPEEKMTEILTDLHMLEGVLYTIQGQNMDSAKKVVYKGYRTVFKKYGITEQQYKRSWTYYMVHPDILDPMMEKVIENISIMQSESLRSVKGADKKKTGK